MNRQQQRQRRNRGWVSISSIRYQSDAQLHAPTTRIASYTCNDRVVSSPDKALCGDQGRRRPWSRRLPGLTLTTSNLFMWQTGFFTGRASPSTGRIGAQIAGIHAGRWLGVFSRTRFRRVESNTGEAAGTAAFALSPVFEDPFISGKVADRDEVKQQGGISKRRHQQALEEILQPVSPGDHDE